MERSAVGLRAKTSAASMCGWASNDTGVIIISNTAGSEGTSLAIGEGFATITAIDESVALITGTAQVEVRESCGNGTPDSVRVVPADSTISVGARSIPMSLMWGQRA